MRYLYKCDNCKKEVIVEKSMNESSREELCECGAKMQRVFTASSIKTSDGIKG